MCLLHCVRIGGTLYRLIRKDRQSDLIAGCNNSSGVVEVVHLIMFYLAPNTKWANNVKVMLKLNRTFYATPPCVDALARSDSVRISR